MNQGECGHAYSGTGQHLTVAEIAVLTSGGPGRLTAGIAGVASRTTALVKLRSGTETPPMLIRHGLRKMLAREIIWGRAAIPGHVGRTKVGRAGISGLPAR